MFKKLIVKLQWKLFNKLPFNSSADFWEGRYSRGGTSGRGSYNKLAAFKAEVLNAFINEKKIGSVIEFGCGDGNQLSLLNIDKYLGFDVSETIVNRCRELFINDTSKRFKHISEYNEEQAELTLSIDVIFHLIEDGIFEKYMTQLFNSSESYVIIYSSNSKKIRSGSPHVKHRTFTDWIANNVSSEWSLLEKIPNKYPYNGDNRVTSFSDFYIFKHNKHQL